MEDQWRIRVMWGTLIANSILLGALVGLTVYAVMILSVAIDQDIQNILGGASIPVSTRWVMWIQPRSFENICYLASAVTATGLFLTYCFYSGSERPSGASLCLSAMLMVTLLVAAYLTFCLLGLHEWKIEQIRFGMGPPGAAKYRKHYEYSHIRVRPPPVISSEVWGAATAGYTVGLLTWGLAIRRRRTRGQQADFQ